MHSGVKMKIGVGVTTTFKRPRTYKLWQSQFIKHTKSLPEGLEIVWHTQMFYPQKHRSIAEVKNLCLKALKDCDFIFLFDDDCFPIRDDWYAPFIETYMRTGNHHFLWIIDDSAFYPPDVGRKLINWKDGVHIFKNCMGCCMFLTNAAANNVEFDERFTGYAFEHEDLSFQVHQLGLNPYGQFLSVPDIEKYIYSLDILGTYPYKERLGSEQKNGKMKSAGNKQDMKISREKNMKLFNEKHKTNAR